MTAGMWAGSPAGPPDPRSRHLLGEEAGDAFRVAVDGVEEPREREAENGSQEEEPEDHLLLQRGHEGDVWAEHVEDPQAQEEHTA